MNMISVTFGLLFILSFCIYYILPQKIKMFCLLILSYAFYASFGWKNLAILGVSSLIVYISGLLIAKFDDTKKSKFVLTLCVLLNIFFLLGFKYTNFLINNVNSIMGRNIKTLSIVLPLGISFYVFSCISYLIDISRKKIEAEKNFFYFALYVSYFPKITSGPIERYRDFRPQLDKKITFEYESVKDGFLILLLGLIQKIVVADRLAIIVDTVYSKYTSYRGLLLLLTTILYTLQIYFDFSGYTNIAMGMSQMLGIKLKDNFRQPYLATSMRDFWKRWHISLTSWFGEYLYIPLGGNRKGLARKYINILIVFAVSGLWHGANWTFVCWGILHGIFQVGEDILTPLFTKINSKLNVKTEVFSFRLLKQFITFMLVNFAWIFFRADSISMAFGIVKRICKGFAIWALWDGTLLKLGLNLKGIVLLVTYIVILIIVDLCREKQPMRAWIRKQNIWFRWSLYLFMIFSVIIFGLYGSDYSASSFIYKEF